MTADNKDPLETLKPSNLSLTMIQGLDRDKIDRLAELNVTNSEVLASQNPFILWLKTPYEFLLIIHWISQAQLYVIMKENKLFALRENGVSGILDFAKVTSDTETQGPLADKIGVPHEILHALIASFEENPEFQRLKQVNDALLVEKLSKCP
jgi:hypothetical protein